MTRRSLAQVVLLAVVAAAAAWWLARALPGPSRATSAAPKRVVSLSPAVTETLFAIGAGDLVVGVDEHCDFPPEVRGLPRAGTAFAPAYETIVSLEPDLILSQRFDGTQDAALKALAPAALLRWTSVEDVVDGIRRVGGLVARKEAAEALARRIETALSAEPPPDAPRTLLVFAHEPGQLQQVLFMKENTLHGALLRAAGARNAVSGPRPGTPALTLESVVAIDPDAVVILLPVDDPPRDRVEALARDWGRLDLQAVERDNVRVLTGAHLYIPGPRILDILEALRQTIASLDR